MNFGLTGMNAYMKVNPSISSLVPYYLKLPSLLNTTKVEDNYLPITHPIFIFLFHTYSPKKLHISKDGFWLSDLGENAITHLFL